LNGVIPNNAANRGSNLSLTLTSDLNGLGINLPAPLGKTPEAGIPMRVNLQYLPSQGVDLRFQYGEILNGITRFKSANSTWSLERGELEFGPTPVSMPEHGGLSVTGSLPDLSLDAWRTYSVQGGSVSGALIPGWLRSVDLRIGHFTGYGQNIDQLHVLLARDAKAGN